MITHKFATREQQCAMVSMGKCRHIKEWNQKRTNISKNANKICANDEKNVKRTQQNFRTKKRINIIYAYEKNKFDECNQVWLIFCIYIHIHVLWKNDFYGIPFDIWHASRILFQKYFMRRKIQMRETNKKWLKKTYGSHANMRCCLRIFLNIFFFLCKMLCIFIIVIFCDANKKHVAWNNMKLLHIYSHFDVVFSSPSSDTIQHEKWQDVRWWTVCFVFEWKRVLDSQSLPEFI